MEKRYRANIESGMIHDLELPCWWALHTRVKSIADFDTQEDACAELERRGVAPVICGRCNQRRTSKKFLQQQDQT